MRATHRTILAVMSLTALAALTASGVWAYVAGLLATAGLLPLAVAAAAHANRSAHLQRVPQVALTRRVRGRRR